LAVLYAALCRSIGLPERPTKVIWQNSLANHYCDEVWSVQERRWRELDSSTDTRPYGAIWILNVPKSMILTPTGESGGWNATAENRLDAFINTINLVYPSGRVLVKVLDHGKPAALETVRIQLPSVIGLVSIARSRTDGSGEMNLLLGESAKYPYRFSVGRSDNADWQWLEVHSNQSYNVVLSLDNERPFDASKPPPPLARTNSSIQ
jgi:hypothetical protein